MKLWVMCLLMDSVRVFWSSSTSTALQLSRISLSLLPSLSLFHVEHFRHEGHHHSKIVQEQPESALDLGAQGMLHPKGKKEGMGGGGLQDKGPLPINETVIDAHLRITTRNNFLPDISYHRNNE